MKLVVSLSPWHVRVRLAGGQEPSTSSAAGATGGHAGATGHDGEAVPARARPRAGRGHAGARVGRGQGGHGGPGHDQRPASVRHGHRGMAAAGARWGRSYDGGINREKWGLRAVADSDGDGVEGDSNGVEGDGLEGRRLGGRRRGGRWRDGTWACGRRRWGENGERD